MKAVKYRRIVVLSRFLVCLGFVLAGIFLFYSAFYSDQRMTRRILAFIGFLGAFWVFGRMALLMIYIFFKDSTIFLYDADKIIVKDTEIDRKSIVKVETTFYAPTGFLGTKAYAFILYCKDKEPIYIHTYYVLTDKELAEVSHILHSNDSGVK